MIDSRYIHPQNKIIIFYFETITASLQHLDQWLIDIISIFHPGNFQVSFKYLSSIFQVSFKHYYSLHQYSILQTLLPIFSDPIHTQAPFQQCSRLNFCKEINDIYMNHECWDRSPCPYVSMLVICTWKIMTWTIGVAVKIVSSHVCLVIF